MKNKNIIPLDITNKISEKYPNVWEQVEQIRNSRDSVLEKWDDHCYLWFRNVCFGHMDAYPGQYFKY